MDVSARLTCTYIQTPHLFELFVGCVVTSNIGLVVFLVMQLHNFTTDHRLQSAVVTKQGRHQSMMKESFESIEIKKILFVMIS